MGAFLGWLSGDVFQINLYSTLALDRGLLRPRNLEPSTHNVWYLNCIDQHVRRGEAHPDSLDTAIWLQPLSKARAIRRIAAGTCHTFGAQNGNCRGKWHIDPNPRVHRFYEFVLMDKITSV
jgi:hypothetical protein